MYPGTDLNVERLSFALMMSHQTAGFISSLRGIQRGDKAFFELILTSFPQKCCHILQWTSRSGILPAVRSPRSVFFGNLFLSVPNWNRYAAMRSRISGWTTRKSFTNCRSRAQELIPWRQNSIVSFGMAKPHFAAAQNNISSWQEWESRNMSITGSFMTFSEDFNFTTTFDFGAAVLKV